MARALVDLTGEVGQQVVAVDVDLGRRVPDLETCLELVDDVLIPVRYTDWPVMNDDRPAVQDCSP